MNPVFPLTYLVLAFGPVLFICTIFAWRSTSGCRRWLRVLIVALRICAVGLMAVLALNPGHWDKSRNREGLVWGILLDQSESMQAPGHDPNASGKNQQSRWQEAVKTVKNLASLADSDRKIDLYAFSDTLERLKSADGLDTSLPGGGATDISGSIAAALNRYPATDQLQGLVLLSDGRQIPEKDCQDAALLALARDVPIYTVGFGGDIHLRDIALRVERPHQIAFAEQTVTLRARLSVTKLDNIAPTVQLLDAAGHLIEQKKTMISAGHGEVAFQLKDMKPGFHEFVLKTLPWEGETRVDNNEGKAGVTVLAEKIKILAIEGVPHWDSKFLMQFIRKQAHIDLTTIVRVTAERFFRIKNDSAGPVDLDQANFPDEQQQLSPYDLILFGKGVEYFLTPKRIKILKTYVRDHGGSILFTRAKPYHSLFPELAALETVAWGAPLSQKIKWQPTSEGEAYGFFGHLLPRYDDPVWNRMPPVSQAFRCSDMKTFSQVMIQGLPETGQETAGGKVKAKALPVLTSRRFGKGMIVALNSEGLWKWNFFPQFEESNLLYEQFWNNLVQWTASHGDYLPGQNFAMHLSKNRVKPNEPVAVRIQQRSPALKKNHPVTPFLKVMQTGKPVQLVQLNRLEDLNPESGQWNGRITIDTPGVYQVQLRVGEGSDAGDSQASQPVNQMLTVMKPLAEADNLSAAPEVLEKIAALSLGKRLTPEACIQLVKHGRKDITVQPGTQDIWNASWDRGSVLVALLICFGLEWHLRRRHGLI